MAVIGPCWLCLPACSCSYWFPGSFLAGPLGSGGEVWELWLYGNHVCVHSRIVPHLCEEYSHRIVLNVGQGGGNASTSGVPPVTRSPRPAHDCDGVTVSHRWLHDLPDSS